MVYYKMTELSIEHILLFVVAAFLLYHLMGSYGCSGNGFRVGGQFRIAVPKFTVIDNSCDKCKSMCNCLPPTMLSPGASGCNKCLD